jgi:hypothetical protein
MTIQLEIPQPIADHEYPGCAVSPDPPPLAHDLVVVAAAMRAGVLLVAVTAAEVTAVQAVSGVELVALAATAAQGIR